MNRPIEKIEEAIIDQLLSIRIRIGIIEKMLLGEDE